MAGISLAESSLAQTLVAFMERVASLAFVMRIFLARVLHCVQVAVHNFFVILYHRVLEDEATWLLRSVVDSVQLGPEGSPVSSDSCFTNKTSFLHYSIYSSLSETAASLSVILSPTLIPPLVVARLRWRVQSPDNVRPRLWPGQQLFFLIFQVSLSFVQTGTQDR